MQINESATPEEGALNVTAPADRTDTGTASWTSRCRRRISGLNEEIRQAVITPGEGLRDLPAPARLLQVLRDSAEAFPLTAAGYEEDTEAALADLLARAGFAGDRA